MRRLILFMLIFGLTVFSAWKGYKLGLWTGRYLSSMDFLSRDNK